MTTTAPDRQVNLNQQDLVKLDQIARNLSNTAQQLVDWVNEKSTDPALAAQAVQAAQDTNKAVRVANDTKARANAGQATPDEVQQAAQTAEAKLQSLYEQFPELSGRLDKIENEWMPKVDGALTAHKKSIDRHETTLAGVTQTLGLEVAEDGTVTAKDDGLAAKVSTLESDVAAIKLQNHNRTEVSKLATVQNGGGFNNKAATVAFLVVFVVVGLLIVWPVFGATYGVIHGLLWGLVAAVVAGLAFKSKRSPSNRTDASASVRKEGK